MDANGVLAAVFDRTNSQLTTSSAGTASASTGTKKLDPNLIWSLVYDRATNSIRTVS